MRIDAHRWLEREKYPTKDILLLRPAMVHLIKHTEVEMLPLLLPPNLLTSRLLVLPLNNNQGTQSGGSHWSLMVVDAATQTFYHYDSIRGCNDRAATHLFSKMKRVRSTPHAILLHAPTPQQTNSYDCGVFVCSITDWLCRLYTSGGLVWTRQPQVNSPNQVRNDIQQIIHHKRESL
jgi:sentrin-specific protease 8